MQGKSAWYDAVCPCSQVLSHISRVLPAQLGQVSSDPVWDACRNNQGTAARKEEETWQVKGKFGGDIGHPASLHERSRSEGLPETRGMPTSFLCF